MSIEQVIKDKQLSKIIMKKLLLIITFVVLLVYAVFHLEGFLDLIKSGLAVISPFLVGIVVAFILNVLVKLFEEKIFAPLNRKNYKTWNKCRRGVCVLIAFVLVLLLIAFVLFLIVPELVRSIEKLVESAPTYVSKAQAWVYSFINDLAVPQEVVNYLNDLVKKLDWQSILSSVTSITTHLLGSLVTVTVAVTSGTVSFFMSLIFAIYMLFSKEKLIHNLKRVLYAFLPDKVAKKSIDVGSLSNRIFANFVAGQCTEAIIIGCLCYLGMVILRIPYALLISTVVAVTSVIPIFGAYIGAIFGGFILLLISPFQCLLFVIYIVVLQNVEGNLIYPRVVGSSVGLPGIWVMLSIFVFGNLFGFIGMLIGVPTCSVLYSLLRSSTVAKLQQKDITDREIHENHLGILPEPPKTELEKEGSVPIKPMKKEKAFVKQTKKED